MGNGSRYIPGDQGKRFRIGETLQRDSEIKISGHARIQKSTASVGGEE